MLITGKLKKKVKKGFIEGDKGFMHTSSCVESVVPLALLGAYKL